jgi:hypothetical protein
MCTLTGHKVWFDICQLDYLKTLHHLTAALNTLSVISTTLSHATVNKQANAPRKTLQQIRNSQNCQSFNINDFNCEILIRNTQYVLSCVWIGLSVYQHTMKYAAVIYFT